MINILAQNVDFIISGTVCNNLAVYFAAFPGPNVCTDLMVRLSLVWFPLPIVNWR